MPETITPPAPVPPKADDTQNKIYPPATPPVPDPAAVKPPEPAAPEPGKQPDPKDDKQGTDGQARVVPEKYDLKLPDGSPLDAKALDEVSSFAKEKKLTQDEAQAVLERESKRIASYVDAQKEQLAQKQKEWIETIKTDKELGGEGMNKTIEMAKRVVDRYGSDSLKKALNDSGLGNHPELVRFVSRIGKAMSEDQLVLPGAAQSTGKKSLEDIFYPPKP
jgi:hypothetical protein